MSNQSQWTEKEGTLLVKFGWYLHQLEADEYMKPIDQRRKIPSLANLARATNFASSSLSRLARGDIAFLNLALCHAIIVEMRRRGFDTQITDIIDFIGPPLHKLRQDLPDHDPIVEEKK